MSPSVAPFLGLALFLLASQLHLLFVKATEQENEDGHVVLPDHDDGEGLSQEPQPPPSIDSAPLTSALADALVSGDNHLVNKPRRGHDPIIFNTADCGSKKGCMFKPKDCIPHTNCSYAFSYSSDAENVYMELLGQIGSDGNAFVAVGFSTDALMGNDTVTDCSSFEGEPFTGRLSFNPGKTNRRVPVENNLQDTILTTHLAQLADGILYCRLSQKIVPVTDLPAYYVRPLNESYRIFLSSGLTESRQLTIHSLDTNSPKFPFISSSNIQLTTFHHTEPVDFSSPTLGAGETTNPNGIHLVGARAAALEEHKHTNRQTDEHFNDDDGNEGPFVPKRDEAPSTISPNVSAGGGPMPAANADLMQKLLKAHGE